MPVQTINYLNAPVAGFEDITKGFNAIYGPQAAKRKADADMLAAEFLKMQIAHEPSKAQYERALKEAQTKEINQKVNLFASLLGEQPPAGYQEAGASPASGQGIENIFGPDARSEVVRVMAGLSPQSPAQAQAMAIGTNQANTDYQTKTTLQNPTSDTLNRSQRLTQMAVPMLTSYLDLVKEAHNSINKAKTGMGTFGKARINAAEPTQILKNFTKGTEGYEEAKSLLTPSIGESANEYQARLYRTVHELLPQIEESYKLAGKETPQEVYSLLEQLKNYQKPQGEQKNSPSSQGKPAFVQMTKDGIVYDIPYDKAEKALEKGYKIGG